MAVMHGIAVSPFLSFTALPLLDGIAFALQELRSRALPSCASTRLRMRFAPASPTRRPRPLRRRMRCRQPSQMTQRLASGIGAIPSMTGYRISRTRRSRCRGGCSTTTSCSIRAGRTQRRLHVCDLVFETNQLSNQFSRQPSRIPTSGTWPSSFRVAKRSSAATWSIVTVARTNRPSSNTRSWCSRKDGSWPPPATCGSHAILACFVRVSQCPHV